jgi:hypothetical protein
MGAEKEREERRRGNNILDAERCFSGVLSLGDELDRKKMRERERKSNRRKGMTLYQLQLL